VQRERFTKTRLKKDRLKTKYNKFNSCELVDPKSLY
jgi:hypothetical protein